MSLFGLERVQINKGLLYYVIVKAGKKCCRQYCGSQGPSLSTHYTAYKTTFPSLTNLLWSTWARQRRRLFPPKASDLFCRGRRSLPQRILQGKGAPRCCRKSLLYFGQGNVCYDRGIRETKAPPVAVESLRYVSFKVGARYDRGIFDQHRLSRGLPFSYCRTMRTHQKNNLD